MEMYNFQGKSYRKTGLWLPGTKRTSHNRQYLTGYSHEKRSHKWCIEEKTQKAGSPFFLDFYYQKEEDNNDKIFNWIPKYRFS